MTTTIGIMMLNGRLKADFDVFDDSSKNEPNNVSPRLMMLAPTAKSAPIDNQCGDIRMINTTARATRMLTFSHPNMPISEEPLPS